jgi:hypothetical protein
MQGSKPSAEDMDCFDNGLSKFVTATIKCPVCGGCLDLHQPDSDLTTQLLATCGDCKTWYVLRQYDQGSHLVALISSTSKPKRFQPLKRHDLTVRFLSDAREPARSSIALANADSGQSADFATKSS